LRRQIEAQLAKGNEWLAGGEEPTSADFMLAFTLLVAADRAGEFTGPKTKEYLWRIQDRFVGRAATVALVNTDEPLNSLGRPTKG